MTEEERAELNRQADEALKRGDAIAALGLLVKASGGQMTLYGKPVTTEELREHARVAVVDRVLSLVVDGELSVERAEGPAAHEHAWEPLQGEFNRYRCTTPGCEATGYKATGVRHPQRGQIVAHKADDSRARYSRPEVTRRSGANPSSAAPGGRRLGVGGTGRKR